MQLRSAPGNAVTLRTAKLQHRNTRRPGTGTSCRTTSFWITTTHGQQQCGSASTSAPMSTSTTAAVSRGPPTTLDGATP